MIRQKINYFMILLILLGLFYSLYKVNIAYKWIDHKEESDIPGGVVTQILIPSSICTHKTGIFLAKCTSKNNAIPFENVYPGDIGYVLIGNLITYLTKLPINKAGFVKINILLNWIGIISVAFVLMIADLRVASIIALFLGSYMIQENNSPDYYSSIFGVFCIGLAGITFFSLATKNKYGKKYYLNWGRLAFFSIFCLIVALYFKLSSVVYIAFAVTILATIFHLSFKKLFFVLRLNSTKLFILSFFCLTLALLLREPIGLIGMISVLLILIICFITKAEKWNARNIIKFAGIVLIIFSLNLVTASLLFVRNITWNLPEAKGHPKHALSHSLVIGLGNPDTPNPWGITRSDATGIYLVKNFKEGVTYSSKEYYQILWKTYLKMIIEQPLEILRIYLKKTRTIFSYKLKILNYQIYLCVISFLILIFYLVLKNQADILSKAHLTFVIGIGIGTASILAFLQGTFSDGWFASVSEIGFIIAITVLLEILIIFSKKKFYTSLDQAKLSRKIKVLIVPVLLVSILSCQNKSNEEILKNASKNNDREKLITILKKGVDINVKNDLGYTPLMIASLNGYTNMVKIMLNHEADVNARTVFNTNALMQAAWNGHLEIVKLLLDANADIHVKSVGGWTPLFFAAVGNYIGYPSIVNLLIEKGSEVDIKDNIYMMPIQWAITHKCNKSVELLKKHSKK